MEYNYCVFIGRFQPLHNAHLQVIKQALTEAKEVILVIGSANAARSIKNPWTYEERVQMIKTVLTSEELKRVHFTSVRDYFYNENLWITQVQQKVKEISKGDQSVCLIGTYKDSSSYYVKLFPQWDFIPASNHEQMNATDIRNDFFGGGSNWCTKVHPWIVSWIANHTMPTEHNTNLCEEHKKIQEYRKSWTNVPFPVSFNTVDAVLIQSGHILVVKRKFHPGKGLLALPGGFLKQNETLEQGSIRELKEETGIKVDKVVLKNNIVGDKTFDYPTRSSRGRTITHAFCIKLPDGELPEVKGADDAEGAFWMSLMDVAAMEDQFFEDHFHIINYFVSRF